MNVDSSPTIENPTHHVKLSQGSDILGLVLCSGDGTANERAYKIDPTPNFPLKIASGEQKYSDMEWPPIVQDDWGAGRGQEVFEDDTTKYLDSLRADTARDGITLGPQEVFTTGLRTAIQFWPWRNTFDNGTVYYRFVSLDANTEKIAIKFTTTGAFTMNSVVLVLRAIGAPGTLNIDLCSDSGGSPGSAVWQFLGFDPSSLAEEQSTFNVNGFAASYSLAATTTYWLVVYPTTQGTSSNHWELLASFDYDLSNAKYYDAGAWADTYSHIFYRVLDAEKPYKAHFFELKGALFAALEYDDASAMKVFINGDQGIATAGSTTTLTDSTKSWTTNEHLGSVLVLMAGTGATQKEPFRRIASNTGTALTLDTAFDVAPDNTTEYAIIGSDKWTEITGHSVSVPVTGVLSINNGAYFALGDATDMKRMRRYNSSGWTTSWTTETGNKANFLTKTWKSGGGMSIWKGTRLTPAQVARADAVDCSGTGAVGALSFGTAITVGDLTERINKLLPYGENGNLHVMKEGSIYEVKDESGTYTPYKFNLDEMASVRDFRNGVAALHHNVYLFFSLHDGVQRYYSGQLDNMGPDQGTGLPVDRWGKVVDLVGAPGRFFGAVDGGPTRFSCVLQYNYRGWSELWRGYNTGVSSRARVRALYIQSIPGDTVDRLWVSVGSDIIWLPIHPNHYSQPWTTTVFHPYWPEAHIVTSYMHANLQDLEKLFLNITAFLVNTRYDINNSAYLYYDRWIEVDYKTDMSEEWTNVVDANGAIVRIARDINDTTDTSPAYQVPIDTDYDKTGKRLALRFRLYSMRNDETPKIISWVIEQITRITYKNIVTFTFRVGDKDHNLRGDPIAESLSTQLDQLKAWAATASPVDVDGVSVGISGKKILINPTTIQPLRIVKKENREYTICQFSAVVVQE